jgi:hypothetical protein
MNTNGMRRIEDVIPAVVEIKESTKGLSLPILNRCANRGEIMPMRNAIPAVNEKDAYIFERIMGLKLIFGFTIPRCNNVLNLSPNAAPMFPRKSVSDGMISKMPGIALNLAFIPTRILPVMLSPITEINNIIRDCLSILRIPSLFL